MAGDSASSSPVERIQSALSSLVDAYRYLDVPMSYYLRLYVGGALLLTVILSVAAQFVESSFISIGLIGLGVLSVLIALIYPAIRREQKRNQINTQFNLFVTHITILSLTNTDRVEVFREIADDETYGALADEIAKLVLYIDVFNLSLDDACRRRSDETPSALLADLYEKVAYNVSAGNDLSSFLYDEQEDVRSMTKTGYISSVDAIDTVSDLFLSTMLASTFLFVFGLLIPFLTGTSSVLVVGGVSLVYVLSQSIFIVLANAIAPNDRLWITESDELTQKQQRMLATLGLGVFASIVVTLALVYGTPDISVYYYPILAVTPLLIPGLVTYRYERSLIDAEKEFPPFIRAVGNIESVKRTSTVRVVEDLRQKDFGSLSPYIDALYRRLFLGNETRKPWELFSMDIGSRIINRFSNMYVVGREMGGDPDKLGKLIGESSRQIRQVRRKRSTTKQKLLGILYGTTAATTFSLFIGLEIVRILVRIGSGIPTTGTQFIYAGSYNIPIIQLILIVSVLFNSLSVGIIVRVVERRSMVGVTIHFVALTYINFILAILVLEASDAFITL